VIDYDSSQPHDNKDLAREIAERIKRPVGIWNTGGNCMAVGIGLGNEEAVGGYGRYAMLTCDGDPSMWILGFYDEGIEESDEGFCVTLMLPDRAPMEVVADHVAGILLRAKAFDGEMVT
jgi:hypothetical protein